MAVSARDAEMDYAILQSSTDHAYLPVYDDPPEQLVGTPASEISSSTGSYCIRKAAVTISAKASAPDADAGSISDMRALLAATKL